MDTNSPVPKWSDIADKDEFKALAPEQQEQTRAAYFDRVIAPRAPAEHLNSIRAEFDGRTVIDSPAPDRSWGDVATDAGASVMSGFNHLGKAVSQVGRVSLNALSQPAQLA